MSEIERIHAEPDLVVTALQQKFLEPDPVGEPVIRVAPDGEAELFVHEDGFEQPAEGVDLHPERFVGDGIDLPAPDADLDDEAIETLGERLGSEVRPALKNEVDLNADRDEAERIVPVDYDSNDP
ncbi:hypothetical protein [Halococcus saccharolyticus]|uniref:Uncharacterized protein n=1 Tax=Halococcus saccharolyticus DSM 5350 TaxID=1227455 RepID=M0MC53_9EURY|nr:hypothetical protein [Halococcus saccharolyticus]EMA43326.1 hypothetical protein C449_15147 [Halococcus saccharolyticus DSM 5350]